MSYQIIDNFLPYHLFITLKNEIVNNKYFSWNYISSLNSEQKSTDLSMYLIHMVYLKHEPLSYLWESFKDIVELLPELKALIRIKVKIRKGYFKYFKLFLPNIKTLPINIPIQAALELVNTVVKDIPKVKKNVDIFFRVLFFKSNRQAKQNGQIEFNQEPA